MMERRINHPRSTLEISILFSSLARFVVDSCYDLSPNLPYVTRESLPPRRQTKGRTQRRETPPSLYQQSSKMMSFWKMGRQPQKARDEEMRLRVGE